MMKTDGRQGGYVDLQARMGGTRAASIRKAGQKIVRARNETNDEVYPPLLAFPQKLPVSWYFAQHNQTTLSSAPRLFHLRDSHRAPASCSRDRNKLLRLVAHQEMQLSCLIILYQEEVDT